MKNIQPDKEKFKINVYIFVPEQPAGRQQLLPSETAFRPQPRLLPPVQHIPCQPFVTVANILQPCFLVILYECMRAPLSCLSADHPTTTLSTSTRVHSHTHKHTHAHTHAHLLRLGLGRLGSSGGSNGFVSSFLFSLGLKRCLCLFLLPCPSGRLRLRSSSGSSSGFLRES